MQKQPTPDRSKTKGRLRPPSLPAAKLHPPASTPEAGVPGVPPDERLLDPLLQVDDRGVDLRLRPRALEEYIGQEKMKANLRVFIQAALARREPLDHVLVYGPPGLTGRNG